MSGTLVPSKIDVDPEVTLIEVPVSRPNDEARAAISVVESLLESGVPKREILVVASTLKEYEPALARAAIRMGLTPTFWVQLDLENTQLYRLLVGTCELLGTDRLIAAEDLQSVLSMGWTPPQPNGNEWPMTQSEVMDAFEGVSPNARKKHSNWRDWFESSEHDGRVLTLLNWLNRDHSPIPPTVESILHGLVVRYREHVLPAVVADDVPALLNTQTAARATVRMQTLVEQAGAKYRARRNSSRITASWESVGGLIESIASQSPGRREHQNARALDILEPNDVWPRRAKYVIVVGLVQDNWPSRTDSLLPAEIRHAINSGLEGTETVVPRPSWTAGRAIDQFAEVVNAAIEGVVLLRHTQTTDGEAVPRSSLLDMVPSSIANGQVRNLLLRETDAGPEAILDQLELPYPSAGDRE